MCTHCLVTGLRALRETLSPHSAPVPLDVLSSKLEVHLEGQEKLPKESPMFRLICCALSTAIHALSPNFSSVINSFTCSSLKWAFEWQEQATDDEKQPGIALKLQKESIIPKAASLSCAERAWKNSKGLPISW